MPDEVTRFAVRERELRTFAELMNAHRVILANAKQRRPGWMYECLAANMLAAFKVEAYLNHLGPLLFEESWRDRLPWHKKLQRIQDQLNAADSVGAYVPTIDVLFRIRNEVAHGRTTIETTEAVEVGHLEELRRRKPEALWEERSSVEFAELAWEHTESLIRRLHEAAGRDVQELHRPPASYCLKPVMGSMP